MHGHRTAQRHQHQQPDRRRGRRNRCLFPAHYLAVTCYSNLLHGSYSTSGLRKVVQSLFSCSSAASQRRHKRGLGKVMLTNLPGTAVLLKDESASQSGPSDLTTIKFERELCEALSKHTIRRDKYGFKL